MSRACQQSVILFWTTPWGQPLTEEGLIFPGGCLMTTDRSQFEHAIAVVFHLPEIQWIEGIAQLPQKPSGQIWVGWSMECDVHYPWKMDPVFMAQFDLRMTYHLNADIPVPYFGPELLGPLRKPPKPKHRGPLAAMFVSSRIDKSRRLKLALDLMRHLDVDSYGRQLQTSRLSIDAGKSTKLEIIANYKFTFAFENAIGHDYVTEKFFEPLIAGSVPVYLGAPNIAEFAPGDHCFINAADFESAKLLANYLTELDHDDDAYGAYLAWKTKPLREEFVKRAEAFSQPRLLALCDKILELRSSRRRKSRALFTPPKAKEPSATAPEA